MKMRLNIRHFYGELITVRYVRHRNYKLILYAGAVL
jgi:hypothetical protein